MTTRRLFIRGMSSALISAPAVVSSASLMKIRPRRPQLPAPPDPRVWYAPAGLYRNTAYDYIDVQRAMEVIRQSRELLTLRVEDWNPLELRSVALRRRFVQSRLSA